MTERSSTRDRAVVRTRTGGAYWYLAWSLAGISFALFLAGVVLTVLSLPVAPAPRSPGGWGDAGAFGGLAIFLPFLAFPLVGALIASRRPRNPIGWICLTAGLFWMLIVLGDSLPPGASPYPVTTDALLQWVWVPPVGLLGIYMILLFPDGRLPSRRWRPLAWLSGVSMILASVVLTIVPGDLPGRPGVRNPFGLEGHPVVAQVLPSVIALLPLCIVASAVSLVWRYRRSGGEVRQQIKWVASTFPDHTDEAALLRRGAAEGDACLLNPHQVPLHPRVLTSAAGELDLLAAGSPCQGFSHMQAQAFGDR